MDLTTRCPQCGTVFSASLDQLQLRKGYIRCINCAHIFDGYEAVVGPSEAGATASAAGPAAGTSTALTPAAGTPAAGSPAAATPVVVGSEPVTRSVIPPAQPPAPAQMRDSVPAAPPTSNPASVIAAPRVVRQRVPGNDLPPLLAGSAEADGPRYTISDEPLPVAARASPPFTISGEQRTSPVRGRPDPVFRVGGIAETEGKPDPVIGNPALDVSGPEPLIAASPQRPAVPLVSPQVYIEPRDEAKRSDKTTGPAFMDREAASGRAWANVVWSVLVAAGIMLLMAQAAYVYRAQLANQVPLLRPMLEQGCAFLNCTVPYARRIDLISIMSSSLRAGATPPAAASKERVASKETTANAEPMMLQVTLRNNHDRPQEWPTLVLDLTDFSGTLVARKNLPPAAYLEPDVAQRPFPANSEIAVSLPVVLNDLKINGYQLSKFFQ